MKLLEGISGLFIEEHGGGCCGIQHLHRFPPFDENVTDDQRRAWINKAINEAIDNFDICDDEDCDCGSASPNEWQTAIEVVLTGTQLPEWRGPLEDCGFKEVFSFHNSNSGNRCHVFYLETNAE